MLTDRQMIAVRFKYKVTILDVRNQGCRGVNAVARRLADQIKPEYVIGSYRNETTGKINVSVHFLTERLRDEALDFIDEKFRHYRVG